MKGRRRPITVYTDVFSRLAGRFRKNIRPGEFYLEWRVPTCKLKLWPYSYVSLSLLIYGQDEAEV